MAERGGKEISRLLGTGTRLVSPIAERGRDRRRSCAAGAMVQRTRIPAFRTGLFRGSNLRRQPRQGVLENGRLSRLAGFQHAQREGISRKAVPRCEATTIDSGLQLSEVCPWPKCFRNEQW